MGLGAIGTSIGVDQCVDQCVDRYDRQTYIELLRNERRDCSTIEQSFPVVLVLGRSQLAWIIHQPTYCGRICNLATVSGE